MEYGISTAKYFGDMDDAMAMKCYDHACGKYGHTQEEADNCDDGSVGCPDCPFAPSK